MTENIIVAIIGGVLGLIGALGGSYFANRKTAALMDFRLKNLEDKVDRHNRLIERTYALEQKTTINEEKIKVANHRIDDLEQKVEKH